MQNYVEGVNHIFYGDGSATNPGLWSLKGDTALQALPQAMTDLKQTFADAGNGLTNPVARNMFGQQARYYMMRHEDQIFRFGQEQQINAAEAGNDSMIASAHNNSALNYNDDKIAGADVDRATAGLVNKYELKYGHGSADANIQQNLRQEAVTANVTGRVDAALNQPTPDFAEAHRIFNTFASQGNPEKLSAVGANITNREYIAAHRGYTDLGKQFGDAAYDGTVPPGLPGGGPLAPGTGASSSSAMPAPYAGTGNAEMISYGKDVAAKYGIPWDVFSHQIAGESSWNPNVVNSGVGPNGGAKGVGQFEDATATKYGVNVTDWKSSLDGAGRYMADLHKQGGTWQAALTGYLTGQPHDAEVTSATTGNPEYQKAYQAARAIDQGGNAPTGTTTSPTGMPDVWGDSLGVGIHNQLTQAAGYQHGGDDPATILGKIEEKPADYWKGRSVILSSGTNGNDMATVKQTINYLQDHGAQVAAIGYGTKYADRDKELQQIVTQAGAHYIAAGVNDGTHMSPAGYRDAAQRAQVALASGAPAQTAAATGAPTGQFQGLIQPGNIDLAKRPVVKNADGTISTVRSMSFNENGQEVLVPTVAADGSGILSNQASIDQYHKTGQFLGKFDTPAHADVYAQSLHEAQAQRYDGGPSATPATTATVDTVEGQPPAQIPALAALESEQTIIARIPQGLPQEVYASAVARANQRRTEYMASIYEQRKSMTRDLKGGEALLADGKPYEYDPAQIRQYFTPSEADPMIDQLDTARDMGHWKNQIQTMNPTQIETVSNSLAAQVSADAKFHPAQFPQSQKILSSFQSAVRSQNAQMLGGMTDQGQVSKADPVGYLRRIDPTLEAKWQAIDPNNPQTVDSAINAISARQDMMGVPKDFQHVVSRTQAEQISQQISADPATAGATMDSLSKQWGSHWGDVFNDAVTLGKLPAPYQIVQHLEDVQDPHDAGLLARGLAGTAKGEKDFWEKNIAAPTKKLIDTGIQGNQNMKMFVHSLQMSGTPVDQMNGLISAVHTLAYAKQAYEGDTLHSDAATDAVNAIIANHYNFLTAYAGNARVPSDVSSTVQSNVAYTLGSFDRANVTIPALRNGVTPEQYIAQLKSSATLVTLKNDQGLYIRDKDGQTVLDANGTRIVIPFNAPRWNPSPDVAGAPAGEGGLTPGGGAL